MGEQRAYGAFVALIVGLFLLIEGSRLDPRLGVALNATFMAVGAVLTLAYFFLIGDYLQRRLRAPGIVTPMPPLLVLGAVMIYQAAFRFLSVIDRALFGVVGMILILVSVIVIYKATKR